LPKLILFIIICLSIIRAQENNESNVKIKVNGGIGYLFNDEHTNTFGGYTTIDKKPGITAALKINYNLDQHNSITIGTEFIKAKTLAKNTSVNTEWIFSGYPFSVGYQHNFQMITTGLYPYISADLAYLIGSGKIIYTYKDEGLIETFNRSERGFGIDGNVGLIYSASKYLEVCSELKFRYSNASIFTEESRYSSIEFSGIYFSLGLIYNF
jgi:hypothetical protein